MSPRKTYGAEEYSRSKQIFPFRMEVEWHTIFTLVGDVKGQRVLDAGCGIGGPGVWLAKTHHVRVNGITNVDTGSCSFISPSIIRSLSNIVSVEGSMAELSFPNGA